MPPNHLPEDSRNPEVTPTVFGYEVSPFSREAERQAVQAVERAYSPNLASAAVEGVLDTKASTTTDGQTITNYTVPGAYIDRMQSPEQRGIAYIQVAGRLTTELRRNRLTEAS